MDEGFDDAPVDALVDARAEVEEIFEGTFFFSGSEDGFEGSGADAFDAGESEEDVAVDDAEIEFRVIDIGGHDFDAVLSSVVDGSDDLIGVILVARHEGGVEFDGVIVFEPSEIY